MASSIDHQRYFAGSNNGHGERNAMAISSLLAEDKPEENGRSEASRKMSLSNITTPMKEEMEEMEVDDDDGFDAYADVSDERMLSTVKHANDAAYRDEKEQYLEALQSRLQFVVEGEKHAHEAHFFKVQDHEISKLQHTSEYMRQQAHKELYDYAMDRVLKQEEADLKEKRRILKRLERQRKKADAAARSAALRSQHEQYLAEQAAAHPAETPNGELMDDSNEPVAIAIKPEPEGEEPVIEVDDGKDDDYAPTKKKTRASRAKTAAANGSAASPASKKKSGGAGSKRKNEAEDKDKSKKQKTVSTPAKKPPSQKEIRAIARLYNNTYESIWKDMARRDASKLSRTIQTCSNIRLSNARKTAALAAKEARRWQFRTNKNFKDLQARARRGMKEMLAFWKRNEREERELRKRAEKEALDQAKREEEEREARRQARKLNFLITQTELYSHFIGRKIKTHEAAGEEAAPAAPHAASVGEVDVRHAAAAKDLDFDEAEDDDLHRAAMANAHNAVMEAKNKAQQFNGVVQQQQQQSAEIKNVDIDSEEMNFQNPTSLGDITIGQPKMLTCQLKEYQLKGLNWLANLYEQGINGILADEMGLGKTVQSISVMAYLAEHHNIWGPFLVIAPASTLHNWQQEIAKFVPEFKALPYWGSSKDRKVLRKFWDRKQLTYTRDSPFHVLITSYQLVVADAPYLNRIKWQYMILDEAQAIKSSSSTRWKQLLSFQCRNRLLLTGTPIQNSMQELWALLHFIMPSLFDSHEEFSEWFSKDIESHATNNSQLNEQQLKRLHMILKPFMLRRVKKNVQSELGDKIEIDVYCDLTNRQRVLYKMLKSQISLMDLIERATSGSDESNQSLMNLVMQFRKVCNHPDLFEREDVKSAFNFASFASTPSLLRDGNSLELWYSARNQIDFSVPKLLYRDGGMLEVPSENSLAGSRTKLLKSMLNLWQPHTITQREKDSLAWLRFAGVSPGELSQLAQTGIFERALQRYRLDGQLETPETLDFVYDQKEYNPAYRLFLIDQRRAVNNVRPSGVGDVMYNLCNIATRVAEDDYYRVYEKGYDEPVLCPPITMYASDRTMVVEQDDLLFDMKIKQALHPMTLNQEWHLLESGVSPAEFPPSNLYPAADNLRAGMTTIRMPSMSKFITQSGKLSQLDRLLTELKANDHRVLIYFQMTKMMDLMEEYLTFRQHKYCRLDGSSKLSDRRDLVNDWQTKPELFVFLLSTRAGGLGINLTAADTVIFYDSDWNPTIDSQAMDRAHRLGQTRQVTVYRLLVKGTIEERMRDRAKQKEQVQHVVMEGNAKNKNASVDFQKPGREVAFWLLDDQAAIDELQRKQQEEESRKEAKREAKRGAKRAGTPIQNGKANNNNSNSGSASNKKRKSLTLEDMYHEDEGNFDESARPSEFGTPVSTSGTNTPVPGRR
ncbi:chromatin-remodeling ATPase Ino80p [Trichomonascus vanleenenianus]|uniref:chromatin-remodeling ATPase INO80 n=1 Tax=Trichomonascus vanleenenianus TaxID=2268995 RepID=UPI003EC9B823